MELKGKKIAFVYSRIQLNNARLLYMPFGLNAVKMLDRMGCEVEVFLSEEKNEDYSQLFSDKVKVFFLDNRIVWKQGMGRRHFYFLLNYFKSIVFRRQKKYEVVFGIGIAGNVLAGYLAKMNKCFFITMNDEFPDIYNMVKWREEEKKSIAFSDMVIVPDETRFEELCREIPGIEKKKWATLPNGPLLSDVKKIPEINWSEKLNLPQDAKPFLFSGYIGHGTMFYDIILTLPQWHEKAVLILCAHRKDLLKSINHLIIEGKVFWIEEVLPDLEFYSLIEFCEASFGMYRTDILKLDYIGKSSGKIMRSIACNRPVIAPKVHSLDFVDDRELGVLINHPMEIPDATRKIISNEKFRENCAEEFNNSLCYEKYWDAFVENIQSV